MSSAPEFCPEKQMYTTDTSSDQPVPTTDLFSSAPRVDSDSASIVDPRQSSLRFGQRPAVCSQPISQTDTSPAFIGEAESSQESSAQIPSWKRILDIICVVLSLPIWLSIMIIIAVWIKLVSSGPILFRQERIGFRGKPFVMLKFRTMKPNAETLSHESYLDQLIQADRPMTKLDASGDPRIIRGGRLLRAMGLDELPQLFNVLQGEMSLVGPRPCTPHEFRRYEAWQLERANAAPGLTGYWQVNGKNKTTFSEMVHLDIFYSRNMSLLLDLTIILRTVPAILGQLLEARAAKLTRHGTD
jgi:lipopolysaccharide/colanic/teichoic acid biosynthesis glycosyltransferase